MEKIAIIGGSRKFREFIALTGADAVYPAACGEALAIQGLRGLLLLPDYDSGKELLPQLSLDEMELLAEKKREGVWIYTENYNAYNFYHVSVFGCEVTSGLCHTSGEVFCAMNGLEELFGGDNALTAVGAAYLPAISKFRDPYAEDNRVLLSKGSYLGTSRVRESEVSDSLPMLIKTGSVYNALFSLTEYDSVNFHPRGRWRGIFKEVFSHVLGVSKERVAEAFEIAYPPIKTRFNADAQLQCDNMSVLCREALLAAVNWHYDSGIILDGDGKRGSVEMIMSSNGQDLYRNRRVDAGIYTGWLLFAAGRYLKREDFCQTGKNLFNYFLENCQLEGGVLDGLFTWYYNRNAGPHWIYSIDSGRCGIALCNMYRLTGDESLLHSIERLAEGFSRLMDDDLLISHELHYKEPVEEGIFDTEKKLCTPAVYAEFCCFMTMASRLLRIDKYMDIVLGVADRMAKEYPNYDYYGHTTSSRYARLLAVLLSAQLTGKRDYSELINRLIDYIGNIQLSSGGIYSEDNLTFDKSREVNNEGGITTPWDNDLISDQLYCVNNALAALSMLIPIPESTGVNREKGLQIFRRLIEYAIKIQIVSDDKRFNGGWMRAYSITHGEYYGLNMDKFWGPYCIMAGWTMGMIPLAILSYLSGECFYF